MVANSHYTRIDTMDLKHQIFRKIGQQRGKRYFDQLKKFFSSKISKTEFDKACIRTIGKENVILHNNLIQSIMKNACMSSTSPEIRNTGNCVETSSQRSCLQSLNGDSLPQSPRRSRTTIHKNRRCTNRPSPLGPFGSSPSIITTEETGVITKKPPFQIRSVESGEEVEQLEHNIPSVQSEVPVITAPLGVSINGGTTRKSLWIPHAGGHCCGYLPDTPTLKDCLEKKLKEEGIGVSMDAANLINHGLDVYMKRLIGSCVKITGPQRSANVSVKDFRVAMEMNPRILGSEWPLQLEKVCFRTSEQ